MSSKEIRTPNGIRFDCSGCGNCCLQWPVPISQVDYKRINQLDLNKDVLNSHSSPLFCKLNSSSDKLRIFTHTLEKRSDGRCTFLSANNFCDLQTKFGAESKPSMCQLFPYFFTVTPSVVLSSVSFASTAVLYNQGQLLSEQKPLLENKLAEFNRLFPDISQSWNSLQIIDGTPINWDEFTIIDKEFERIIYSSDKGFLEQNETAKNLSKKLLKMSSLTSTFLDKASLIEQSPELEASPEIVDQLILKYLDKLYFPEDVFNEKSFDLDNQQLLREIVAAPKSVEFGTAGNTLSFQELTNFKIGELQAELSNLLDRFLYCRIFSKLFFGPGYHHLSLLAGIHHLYFVDVLLKLKIKNFMLTKQTQSVSLPDFAEIVRTLERRMTQISLSPQSKAVLEVLLTSQERARRIENLSD